MEYKILHLETSFIDKPNRNKDDIFIEGLCVDSNCYKDSHYSAMIFDINDGYILNETSESQLIAQSICDKFTENLFESARNNDGFKITGILLSVFSEAGDKYYTRDFLNNMSLQIFKKIVEFLMKYGIEACKELFNYNTYRINNNKTSAYDNIEFKVEDQYRLSDHWNVTVRNRIVSPTVDGIIREKELCLGQWNGEKWEIIKEIKDSKPTSEIKIISFINSLKLFRNNDDINNYIKDKIYATR